MVFEVVRKWAAVAHIKNSDEKVPENGIVWRYTETLFSIVGVLFFILLVL